MNQRETAQKAAEVARDEFDISPEKERLLDALRSDEVFSTYAALFYHHNLLFSDARETSGREPARSVETSIRTILEDRLAEIRSGLDRETYPDARATEVGR